MREIAVYPKAIIFDWDDTLVDNWHSIHTALNATLKIMGHEPWPFSRTKSNVRQSMRDSFPVLFGDRWKEAAGFFLTQIRRSHLESINVLDYVPEMLQRFHQEGIYLGVVSNKNGQILREEAEYLKWNKWFSNIVGAGDAVRDKPDRAPVDLALNGSGIITGREVWFVGDALPDMECAHNAGVFAVLIGDKNYNRSKYSQFPPQVSFKNAHEILKFVDMYKTTWSKPEIEV